MKQVRACDGVCCKQNPRWPNEDGTDCIFHDRKDAQGCMIMRGEAEIPATLLQRGSHEITVENPDFAFGTTDDAEAEDLFHLGVRPRISNAFLIIVKPPGAPISIHPNEAAHIVP